MSLCKPILAVAFAVAICLGCGKPVIIEKRSNGTEEGGVGVQNSDAESKPNPELEALDGKKVRLADFRGKVVLIDFWATWCAPCLKGLPHSVRMMKRHADNGLVVLAVTDEDKHEIEEFVKNTGLDVPAFRDPDGDAFRAFQVMALPTVVVLDREGNVVANLPQLRPAEEVEEALRQAGLEL